MSNIIKNNIDKSYRGFYYSMSILALAFLAACSSGDEKQSDAPQKVEKPDVPDVSSLVYGRMVLPKYKDRTEFLSPEYVYDMGDNAKKIYDKEIDSNEHKFNIAFAYISHYKDCDGGLCGYEGGYISDAVMTWSNAGSLLELQADVSGISSPQIFRDRFEKFCSGKLNLSKEESGLSGSINGKYAKCYFWARDNEYSGLNVVIKYKKGNV